MNAVQGKRIKKKKKALALLKGSEMVKAQGCVTVLMHADL